MKEGLSLQEMAVEIERQHRMKEDYLISTENLRLEPYGSDVYLHMYDKGTEPIEPLVLNSLAHTQLGERLGIPAKYYERMRIENPELLAHNVNTWFQAEPEKRMLRTINGTLRAFLSERYRRIDNIEVAKTVLPILGKMKGARFESCQLTDRRMYIKVVNERLTAEVSPGDIVQAGVIISNSEVGEGSVSIQPLVYRLVCRNGMVVNDARTKKTHLGRVNNADANYLLFSQETLEAEDHAFVLKIRDTVDSAVNEARFSKVVDLMKQAREVPMDTHDIPNLVRLASREFKITEEESGGVLQHLIEGKDLTLYGLSNAVTRYSQDIESYDRATQMEGIGYNILSMPQRQWNRINQMAA